jgi:hypothetical protein
MGKVTLICVFLVFALLLEDGSSVRKKTEVEEKEERELAEKVNATLEVEEEKRRKEDEAEKKKLEDEKEKKKNRTEKGEKKEDVAVKGKDQDEACPPLNSTCPEERTCPEDRTCPPCEDCPVGQDCPPCKRCGTCPPCGPCPVDNTTVLEVDCPVPPACPEPSAMTVPVAMAVGAAATLLAAGVAAVLGLLLRYVPPLISGFLFLFLVALTWYLSSHYPETAREWGGRAWTALQEATVALGHRVMEALRHHQEQVSVPIKPYLFF